MDFLKEHLGDLYAQVEAILKDNDKIKLANLASGEYVSKSKFDAQEKHIKDAKLALDERDKQLSELKTIAAGSESLQEEIKKLQELNSKAAAEYESKLKQTEYDYALKEALTQTHKARDAASVIPHLNQEGIKYAENRFIGLDEQIAKIKESKAYLFASDNEGVMPGTGGTPNIPPNAAGGVKAGFNFDFSGVRARPQEK